MNRKKSVGKIWTRPRWFVRNIDSDRVYFNYKRAPYLRSKWPLVVLAVVEIGALSVELLLNHTAYFQVITIPLILFC